MIGWRKPWVLVLEVAHVGLARNAWHALGTGCALLQVKPRRRLLLLLLLQMLLLLQLLLLLLL